MLNRVLTKVSAAALVIGVAACGASESSNEGAGEQGADAGRSAVNSSTNGQSAEPTNPYGAPVSEEPAATGTPAARMTAAFLDGPWCNTHFSTGVTHQDVNRTHVFNRDGTLLYNNSPGTGVDREGNWFVEGEYLRLHPTMAGFNLTVKSVSDNEFVISGMGEFTFVRGACAGDELATTADEGRMTIADLNPITVYLNEDGQGVLRYTVPGGAAGEQYWYSTGAFVGDERLPIEVLSTGNGPYTGPNIGMYFIGMGKGLPLEQFVLTLQQRDPFRDIQHFIFEIDPAKAESEESCAPVTRLMECSK